MTREGRARIFGPQSALTPSPGTPGEGWGGGSPIARPAPHLNPPPEYEGRRQEKTSRIFAHAPAEQQQALRQKLRAGNRPRQPRHPTLRNLTFGG
jgi:hypothetical protein